MKPKRVIAFIDGFNLYHAINDLGRHDLKWVDLRKLCGNYAPDPQLKLTQVYYFSAFATWRTGAFNRHRRYVRALQTAGVTPVMGNFKAKDRRCRACGSEWVDHEEKETDVNIALYLLMGAFRNDYDRALLISGDSDLVPPVQIIRKEFPQKEIRIIAPAGRGYSMDLYNAAGGKKYCRQMKLIHLERSLLPKVVRDLEGRAVTARPHKYDPLPPP